METRIGGVWLSGGVRQLEVSVGEPNEPLTTVILKRDEVVDLILALQDWLRGRKGA